MPMSNANNSVLYTGTWDCAKKTVAKEGIRGLYKGIYILYKCLYKYPILIIFINHKNI